MQPGRQTLFPAKFSVICSVHNYSCEREFPGLVRTEHGVYIAPKPVFKPGTPDTPDTRSKAVVIPSVDDIRSPTVELPARGDDDEVHLDDAGSDAAASDDTGEGGGEYPGGSGLDMRPPVGERMPERAVKKGQGLRVHEHRRKVRVHAVRPPLTAPPTPSA